MKKGDYFIDTYYEGVVLMQAFSNNLDGSFKCEILISTEELTLINAVVLRAEEDEFLVPVTVIHIDAALIPIRL